MMNPPEATIPKQKKFSITFEVTEGKTTGHIISFDHVSSSILSSLSSGALADHSSLSESNESFPHLTTHSSTSTCSSGLSASRTAKRHAKPCQCCSVLNYLKLHCVCGHGNLLFVRDVSSSKDGGEVKDGARLPEVCSDMDLTDPVVSDRGSSTDIVTPSEDTQDTPTFPKIRLSIRPECNVSTALDASEDEFDDEPGGWNVPKWEKLLAYPYELPLYHRSPMIPSHYKEDKRSRFLKILWIGRTLYAHEHGSEPPRGITRVFYDPRFEPELPEEECNFLKKFSDNEIVQLMKSFEEACELAKRKAAEDGLDIPELFEFESDDPEVSELADEAPDIGMFATRPDSNCSSSHPGFNLDYVEEHFEQDHQDLNPDYIVEDFEQGTVGSHLTTTASQNGDMHSTIHVASNTYMTHHEYQFSTETDHAHPTVHVASNDGGRNITLVYAKFQKWYYPGWINGTTEDWDSATQPITVHFYDDSPDKDLAPDMIVPLQRLPPGANCQRQLESNIYDDVFYMSFTPSSPESEVPSATVHILSENSPVTTVSFPCTALSPKDVVQIRSALKSAFYPSKSRVNFTELTTGSILGYASRRRAAAASDERRNKPQKVSSKKKKGEAQNSSSLLEVPSKKKEDEAQTPSSSSEAAPSAPKRRKIEVASSTVVEPSSTGASVISPEVAPSAPKHRKIEVTSTPVVEPSSKEASITSPEAAPSASKPRKIKVTSTPVVEPSSSEASITSPEAAPSASKHRKIEVTSTPVVEPSSSEESNVWYICTAPRCGETFDSEQLLLAHREKLKTQKKRQHSTMQVVSRNERGRTSSKKVVTTKKQVVSRDEQRRTSSRHAVTSKKEVVSSDVQRPTSSHTVVTSEDVNSAGPSKPGSSRDTVFPSGPVTDSETDTGPLRYMSQWGRCVQGYGLQQEKCTLSDKVKSFTQLKGRSRAKCPPRTKLFSSQHFILTNGPPHTFKGPRTRAVDSESESTDFENYYSTSLEFDVLKLQRAIECGSGHIYADFADIPAELQKNPGHNLIVVSGHPTCTANYIFGVSLGCTIVRHDTIFDCVKRKVSLRDALRSGSASLLSPGWCEQKRTWAPPRASPVHPLDGLVFFLALNCNLESKSFWCALIRHLGGKPITIEVKHQYSARLDRTIYGIVAEPEVSSHLATQAAEMQVPIVNTSWVIQAVITGSKPPFSSYKVTFRDSSS